MDSFSNELQNELRKPLQNFVKTFMTEKELNEYLQKFDKFQSINDTRFLLMVIQNFWDKWTLNYNRRNVNIANMRELLNILSHPGTRLNFTWHQMDDYMKDFLWFLDVLSSSEYKIESAKQSKKVIESLWERIEKKGHGPFYNYTIESIYKVKIIPDESSKENAIELINAMLGIEIEGDEIILDLKQFNEIKSFMNEKILGKGGTIDNSGDYHYYAIDQMDDNSYEKFKKLQSILEIVDDMYVDNICIFRRKNVLNEIPPIGGIKFKLIHLEDNTFLITSDFIGEIEKRIIKGNIKVIAKSHKVILVCSNRETIEKHLSLENDELVPRSNAVEKKGKKKNKKEGNIPQSPLKKKENEKQEGKKKSENGKPEEKKSEVKKQPKIPTEITLSPVKPTKSTKVPKQGNIPVPSFSNENDVKQGSNIVSYNMPIIDPSDNIYLVYKIDLNSENEWPFIESQLNRVFKNPVLFLIEKKGKYSFAASYNDYQFVEGCLSSLKCTYVLRQNQFLFSIPVYNQYILDNRHGIEKRYRCKVTSTATNIGYRFGINRHPILPFHEFIKILVDISSSLYLDMINVDIHKSHLNSFGKEIASISKTSHASISFPQKNQSKLDEFIHINISLLGSKENVMKAIDLIKNINDSSLSKLSKQFSNLKIQPENDEKPMYVGLHYLIYFRRVYKSFAKKLGKETKFKGELKREIQEKMKNIVISVIKDVKDSGIRNFVCCSYYLKETLKSILGGSSNKLQLIGLNETLYIMSERQDHLDIASKIVRDYISQLETISIPFPEGQINRIRDILHIPRSFKKYSIHPYYFSVDLTFDGNNAIIIKGTKQHIDAYVAKLIQVVNQYIPQEVFNSKQGEERKRRRERKIKRGGRQPKPSTISTNNNNNQILSSSEESSSSSSLDTSSESMTISSSSFDSDEFIYL